MSAYPMRAALAGVLLFVLGLAFAGGVYQINDKEREQFRGWVRTEGTVVELLKRRSPDGDRLVPIVAFTTPAGERVSLTVSPGARDSPYYQNAPIKLLYDPARPQDAILDASARRWTRNALAGGAAIILMALGGYVAWFASRWDRMPPAE